MRLPRNQPRLAAYQALAQIAMEADDIDDVAADDIRSLMDTLWRQLTRQERERLHERVPGAKEVRVVLRVLDRDGCPFRRHPQEDTFGPAFITCEHPQTTVSFCEDGDGRPKDCPLKDGDQIRR